MTELHDAGDENGLRTRAEEALRKSTQDIQQLPVKDLQVLVHELQVHQIELKMQNEELRETQMKLEHARDRYSALYELAPVGYVMLDINGGIIEANLTAAGMLGVARTELIGKRLSVFLTRDDQEVWHHHKQSVFANNGKQTCEVVMRKAGGAEFVAQLESNASIGADEGCRQLRIALIDITELKLARHLLEESDRRYRRLTDAVTDYVYRVRVEDGKAVETVHGANCEAVTGYTPEQFAEDPLLWMAMVPPEDRPAVQRQADRILSNQDARPIEHRIRRKDGALRWVLNTMSPQLEDRDRLVAYDGLLRDVSERKEAEIALEQLNWKLEEHVEKRTAELHDSNQRLSAILDAAVDAIIAIDRDGIVVSMNPATEAMFGYSEQELVGQNVKLIMPLLYCDEHDGYLAGYHETREPRLIGHGLEVSGVRKDGSIVPIDLSVSEVDHLGLFIGILRDISERKELQKTVLNIAADEGRRIGQELHDGVGQELTGLSLYAGTLAQRVGEVGDKNSLLSQVQEIATKLLQGIDATSKHVQSLCHGIMPVQVDALGLKAALDELAASTNEHIACCFECQSNVELADNTTATQLYRIAQEAVTNALKHSQAQQIEISLRNEDGSVIVVVTDDGIGIDPNVSATAAVGRSGLGLGIMHYRAGITGATLRVGRREEGGTQVTCTLNPAREP